MTLLSLVAFGCTVGCTALETNGSASEPIVPAAPVAAQIDNGPGDGFSLTECGSVGNAEVIDKVGRSNMIRSVKNILGCRWETGLEFGDRSTLSFFWYRGSSMEKEANVALLFGHDVKSISIAGHPGYLARGSVGLCEVSVGSGSDFFHWSLYYGDAVAHPDPCEVARGLAELSVSRSK
ncbi:MAG: DUF3558 domain-containing protein [Mycobacteriaceae bacterium]